MRKSRNDGNVRCSAVSTAWMSIRCLTVQYKVQWISINNVTRVGFALIRRIDFECDVAENLFLKILKYEKWQASNVGHGGI